VLSSIPSLSSEPYKTIIDDESPASLGGESVVKQEIEPDRVVKCYENHEDSVYNLEWSSADPWIFASLSYDGRLVIDKVPKEEKYKILL
jgi:WD40 repeat protein